MPSEAKFQGFGVSACATCDGFFFRGKEVVVVGGGNTAVEEALYLSHLASKVTLVHRRDSLRAEKILQDRLFKRAERSGDLEQRRRGDLRQRNPAGSVDPSAPEERQDRERLELKTDGVFIAIGHKPATELFAGQLDMKAGGYLQTAPGFDRDEHSRRIRRRRRNGRRVSVRP